MKGMLVLLYATSLFAQDVEPGIRNAKLTSRTYQGDLDRQIVRGPDGWFGYAVETKSGNHHSCCWGGGREQGCELEEGTRSANTNYQNSRVRLEGGNRIAMLFRIDPSGLKKIAFYSMDCPLDGGGLPFTWIDRVPAPDSLAFLNRVLHVGRSEQITDSAIAAIAQHNSPDADVILAKLAQSAEAQATRQKAIFWLGAARGAAGVPALKQLLTDDPNETIREKAIFALSISKQPQALTAVMDAAGKDPSARVRGQALFWLAQKAGERAGAAIMNAIQNDPDTQVKEKAVFALSQLPKDEAIPKLIQVASDGRNAQVQKKAFFWLGQSGDPRALAFIEKVLKN